MYHEISEIKEGNAYGLSFKWLAATSRSEPQHPPVTNIEQFPATVANDVTMNTTLLHIKCP